MNAPQSWMQRALGWAITFVVVALLIRWGWDLLRPMIPIVLGLAAVLIIGRFALGRYRRF